MTLEETEYRVRFIGYAMIPSAIAQVSARLSVLQGPCSQHRDYRTHGLRSHRIIRTLFSTGTIFKKRFMSACVKQDYLIIIERPTWPSLPMNAKKGERQVSCSDTFFLSLVASRSFYFFPLFSLVRSLHLHFSLVDAPSYSRPSFDTRSDLTRTYRRRWKTIQTMPKSPSSCR